MAKRHGKTARNKDLRSLILDTALHLFSTRGYFNTSVHDIRREADISIGSIYNYFESKEAIATALYEDLLGNMTEALEDIVEHYPTPYDRCKAVMAYLFQKTETDPEAMHFMLYAKHREFMPSAIPICSSKPFAMMRQMVQEGIDAGVIAPMDLTVATTCLYGGMFRMINLRLDGVITTPLPALLEKIWECGWKGVAA